MGRAPLDDTSADIRRRQQAIYARMTPAEKVAIVEQLNALSDGFALAGLRAEHPEADERELSMRLLVRKHGPELIERPTAGRRMAEAGPFSLLERALGEASSGG